MELVTSVFVLVVSLCITAMVVLFQWKKPLIPPKPTRLKDIPPVEPLWTHETTTMTYEPVSYGVDTTKPTFRYKDKFGDEHVLDTFSGGTRPYPVESEESDEIKELEDQAKMYKEVYDAAMQNYTNYTREGYFALAESSHTAATKANRRRQEVLTQLEKARRSHNV